MPKHIVFQHRFFQVSASILMGIGPPNWSQLGYFCLEKNLWGALQSDLELNVFGKWRVKGSGLDFKGPGLDSVSPRARFWEVRKPCFRDFLACLQESRTPHLETPTDNCANASRFPLVEFPTFNNTTCRMWDWICIFPGPQCRPMLPNYVASRRQNSDRPRRDVRSTNNARGSSSRVLDGSLNGLRILV